MTNSVSPFPSNSGHLWAARASVRFTWRRERTGHWPFTRKPPFARSPSGSAKPLPPKKTSGTSDDCSTQKYTPWNWMRRVGCECRMSWLLGAAHERRGARRCQRSLGAMGQNGVGVVCLSKTESFRRARRIGFQKLIAGRAWIDRAGGWVDCSFSRGGSCPSQMFATRALRIQSPATRLVVNGAGLVHGC